MIPHTDVYMSRVGVLLYELTCLNFLELRISQTLELNNFDKLLKDLDKKIEADFNFYDRELYGGLV